jgi:hypothetical protein
MFPLRLFIWIFMPFMAFSAVGQVSSSTVIDFRRIKLHEEIDGLQSRICALDGKADKMIVISRDIDLDLLLTDIYTRQTDSLQLEIEKNTTVDHRIKVKYLTGLNILLEELLRSLRSNAMLPTEAATLLDAYRQYMGLDIRGISIAGIVDHFPFTINKMLLGENSVFFENPIQLSSRVIMFRQFAGLYPDQVLSKIEPYLDASFADSLLVEAAHHYPERFYNYAAAAGTPIGKKIRSIDDTLVRLITGIADESSGRLIFPFLHSILKGRISIDSIKSAATDSLAYYRLLVKTQIQFMDDIIARDTPILFQEMGMMIKRKAEEIFINEINALHDEPEAVRFKILAPLGAAELYYIIVTGEDVIYTSSYTGVYNRMMGRMQKLGGDALLIDVRFDRFKKFIRMAAAYNRLDHFLSSMPAANAELLIKGFVRGLEKNLNLEDAVDVADSYGSISKAAIRVLVKDEIEHNLEQQKSLGNERGVAIYNILKLLFMSASDSSRLLSQNYGIPPVYALPISNLTDTAGRIVQQVFFYGDKDGKESFTNFMSMFRGKKEWQIVQEENWVEIKSLAGRPVWIFANLPLDNSMGDDPDAKAQSLLIGYLRSQGLQPTIVIHRGHSYHLKYTVKQLPASAKIIVLGSCGSFQNLNTVLNICPDAHIVSSKEVGTKLVNEPVLKLINESVRKGQGVDWISIWHQLEKQFNTGVAKERFDNYIPPHKNLGALFIKAFTNRDH